MFPFDITKHVPRFILADKNGYAVAKAIEGGLQMMNDTMLEGIERLFDVDKMPEWRLDELAWEYDMPYDYKADIEIKRSWVQSAYRLSRLYGTPEGVRKFVSAYFDEVTLTEAKDYGGDPYHYRLDMYGTWSEDKQNWAITVAEIIKNVRSVVDKMVFHFPDVVSNIDLYAGLALYGAVWQRFGATEQPDIDGQHYLEDELDFLLDEKNLALSD